VFYYFYASFNYESLPVMCPCLSGTCLDDAIRSSRRMHGWLTAKPHAFMPNRGCQDVLHLGPYIKGLRCQTHWVCNTYLTCRRHHSLFIFKTGNSVVLNEISGPHGVSMKTVFRDAESCSLVETGWRLRHVTGSIIRPHRYDHGSSTHTWQVSQFLRHFTEHGHLLQSPLWVSFLIPWLNLVYLLQASFPHVSTRHVTSIRCPLLHNCRS